MIRTGAYGRPWVTLEPKPQRVSGCYRYWTDPPPQISERCSYWLRQIDRGWLPSRRLRMQGYGESTVWYGVYVWEYFNLILPAIGRLPRDVQMAPVDDSEIDLVS